MAALLGYIVSYSDQVEKYLASKAEQRSARRSFIRLPQRLVPPAPLHPHRRQRSINQLEVEELEQLVEFEELFMSSIVRLDRDRCVMKLLCHLDNKAADKRTLEENVLLLLFSNNPDTLTSYNAAFEAAKEDGHNLQQATCDQVFPRCPIREDLLDGVLQNSLGCGYNFSKQ